MSTTELELMNSDTEETVNTKVEYSTKPTKTSKKKKKTKESSGSAEDSDSEVMAEKERRKREKKLNKKSKKYNGTISRCVKQSVRDVGR